MLRLYSRHDVRTSRDQSTRSSQKKVSPHPEERAIPIPVPTTTAEIGLHHITQPTAKLELTKYRANPAVAPIRPPMKYFMIYYALKSHFSVSHDKLLSTFVNRRRRE